MASIFEDEEQQVLKVPLEIWDLIMDFFFWINPRQLKFCSRASYRVLKSNFALTSKAFHQLVNNLTKTITKQNESLFKGSVATFCSSNGYTSLLKYAIENKKTTVINKTITEAARFGHLECFKMLLEEHGCTLNTKYEALNEASGNNQMNIVKYITVDQGLIPTFDSAKKAITSGSIEMVKFLTRWDIIHSYDGLGYLAVQSGNFEMVKYIEQFTSLDQSCVTASAIGGNIEILQYLLDKGFTWNDSVCQLAMENGHKKFLKYALSHGAPIGRLIRALAEKNDTSVLQELQGKKCPWDGWCLEVVARKGQLELLKFMLENSEDVPQHVREKNLKAVLVCAVQCGHKECIRYLLEQGVQHDTIIDEAMERSVVKFLRDHGCAWSTHTTDRAAKRGDFNLLRYLHENGCPWNSDKIMDNIVTYCAYCSLTLLQYLREEGCSWDENTMFLAARKGYDKILQYLHENGCPWDERTSNATAQFCRIDCLKYVLDNGCPWDTQLMDLAVTYGSLETLQYLRQKGVTWTDNTCSKLIFRANLDMLKYAHENGAQWKKPIIITAYNDLALDCLEYALANGCPWDPELSQRFVHRCKDKKILELYRRMSAKK